MPPIRASLTLVWDLVVQSFLESSLDKHSMNWSVYIILCTDNSLYTGVTTDVSRRFLQHGSSTGAKYFRGRAPMHLIYVENGHNRSSACKRESAIKKLKKPEKMRLIASESNQLGDDVVQGLTGLFS
jgi:putative endonuclease